MKQSDYSDKCKLNEPRKYSIDGSLLPNPRTVALKVHFPQEVDNEVNTLTVWFGQFIDHDLSLTGLIPGKDGKAKQCKCNTLDPDCINIPTPPEDPYYDIQKCQVTARSSGSFIATDCTLTPRQQINLLPVYVDLSMVYGVTKEDSLKYRAMTGGLLKFSYIPGSTKEHLPQTTDPNEATCIVENGYPCFYGK